MRAVNGVRRASIIAFPALLALGSVNRKLFGKCYCMTRTITFANLAYGAFYGIEAEFSQSFT